MIVDSSSLLSASLTFQHFYHLHCLAALDIVGPLELLDINNVFRVPAYPGESLKSPLPYIQGVKNTRKQA